MFNSLLKLYRKNRKKTPLEDFTTELFVGVLKNDSNVSLKFINELIGFQSDFYKISSQKKFFLKGRKNCIVDIVVESQKEICFIENKVNSKEGENQLGRYAEILNEYKEKEYKTKLLYCTKNPEPKKIKAHDFLQIKWFDINQICLQYSQEKLTKLFSDFLNSNNMSDDMTIYSKDLIALENFTHVHNIFFQHLENAKSEFIDRFGNSNFNDHRHTLKSQILTYNRLSIFKKPVIQGEGYSEILYGVNFTGELIVQLFLYKTHPLLQTFQELARNNNELKYQELENTGVRLYSTKNLGVYLNDENSQEEIKFWFEQQFKKIQNFQKSSENKINWIK